MHSEIVDQVYGLRDTLPRGQVNKRKLDEWRIRVELQVIFRVEMILKMPFSREMI